MTSFKRIFTRDFLFGNEKVRDAPLSIRLISVNPSEYMNVTVSSAATTWTPAEARQVRDALIEAYPLTEAETRPDFLPGDLVENIKRDRSMGVVKRNDDGLVIYAGVRGDLYQALPETLRLVLRPGQQVTYRPDNKQGRVTRIERSSAMNLWMIWGHFCSKTDETWIELNDIIEPKFDLIVGDLVEGVTSHDVGIVTSIEGDQIRWRTASGSDRRNHYGSLKLFTNLRPGNQVAFWSETLKREKIGLLLRFTFDAAEQGWKVWSTWERTSYESESHMSLSDCYSPVIPAPPVDDLRTTVENQAKTIDHLLAQRQKLKEILQ